MSDTQSGAQQQPQPPRPPQPAPAPKPAAPPKPPVPTAAPPMTSIRGWVTAAVIGGFFMAYVLNWFQGDTEALNLMNGALIAAFAGAWGYWLGSSSGSDSKTNTISDLVSRDP
jgi:hypothetical protein